MAKIKPTYHKLGLKVDVHKSELTYNDQIIEVKDYLPIEDKMKMVADIIIESKDDNPFMNVGKMNAYLYIYILYNYTNLVFTEKQKEEPGKIYDNIVTTGFLSEILKLIPKDEIDFIKYLLNSQIEEIYKYDNSIRGMLQDVMTDYSNLSLDATTIQKKLQDPNNLKLLKGVMNELG